MDEMVGVTIEGKTSALEPTEDSAAMLTITELEELDV